MKLLLAFALFVAVISAASTKKKVVCYHGTWAVYRHSNGKFEVPNINPYLCTHLIYAFFGIHENGDFRIIDPYLDLVDNWGRGNIKKFNDLKKINTELKTIAAVGGWNEGSYKFSQVAKDPVKRRRFIQSSVEFLKKHDFDGLDMDWEYPAQRDGDPKIDKENHLTFIKELKAELSKNNLLLTAAVASAEFSAGKSYDILEVSKYLDFINVMAYDLHGAWDKTIGINSPLYESPVDVTPLQKQLNTNASINYWLSNGAPADKIILGVPLYGRTFTLASASQTAVGSPNVGPGLPGRYSNEPGMIGYNELCEKFKTEDWTVQWDDDQKVPYAYKGNQWIGYDDLKSIEYKVKFASDNNLGGIMVWSIETDDFRAICGPRYPLMTKINKLLGREVKDFQPQVPTIAPPTVPPTGPTGQPGTNRPPAEGCKTDGTFRHPQKCSSFYTCVAGIRHDFNCPGNLMYNAQLQICDFPHNVKC